MPDTHGAALALEDYLANHRSAYGSSSSSSSNGASNGSSSSSSYAPSYSRAAPAPSPYSSVTGATASGGRVSAASYGGSSSAGQQGQGAGQGVAFRRTNGNPGSSSGGGVSSRSSYEPLDPSSYLPYRSMPSHAAGHPGGGGSGPDSGSGSGHAYAPHAQQLTSLISKLGSSPEEFLTKIQIRGMFPGSVSEWYLPTMSHEEAAHVLGCLVAARRLVLQRVSAIACALVLWFVGCGYVPVPLPALTAATSSSSAGLLLHRLAAAACLLPTFVLCHTHTVLFLCCFHPHANKQVRGSGYDEYVDRWSTAEAEGDWWGMEWLWQ